MWNVGEGIDHLGDVIGHSVPGLITLRHRGPATIDPGSPLLVFGDDGRPNVAVALSYVGVSDGHWLRALQLELPSSIRDRIPPLLVSDGRCARLDAGDLLEKLEKAEDAVLHRRDQLIGIVAGGTSSTDLRFEIVREDCDLAEGVFLEVEIRGRPALYQLLEA